MSAAFLLSASFWADWQIKHPPPLKEVERELEAKIDTLAADFGRLLNDSTLSTNLTGSVSPIELKMLLAKPYIIAVYKAHDVGPPKLDGKSGPDEGGLRQKEYELHFWNNNSALPSAAMAAELAGSGYLKLKNGYYAYVRDAAPTWKQSGTFAVALLRIKSEYYLDNKYLSSGLDKHIGLPDNLSVSDTLCIAGAGVNCLALKADYHSYNPSSTDSRGNVYIHYQNNSLNKHLAWRVTALQLLSLLLIAIGFTALASKMAQRRFVLGFAFLLLSFSLLGLAAYLFKIPKYIADISFLSFKGANMSGFNLGYPEGYVLAAAVALTWITAFAFAHYKPKKVTAPLARRRFLFGTAFLSFSLLICLMAAVIRILILDYSISFEVIDFSFVKPSNIIGITSYLLCVFSVLFAGKIAQSYMVQLELGFKDRLYISLAVLAALAAALLAITGTSRLLAIATIVAVLMIYSVFMYRYAFGFDEKIGMKRLFMSISILILFSSALASIFVLEREKNDLKNFAQLKVRARDYEAEKEFEKVALKVMYDKPIADYFEKLWWSEKEIIARLKHFFEGTGLSEKYNLKVIVADGSNKPLNYSPDYDRKKQYMERGKNNKSFAKSVIHLQPASHKGVYYYQAKLPIFVGDKITPQGFLAMEITPINYRKTNVYPELVVDDQYRPLDNSVYFSYAIYTNEGTLESNDGEYQYKNTKDRAFAPNSPDGSFLIDYNDHTHYISQLSPPNSPDKQPEEAKTIVVSTKSNRIIRLVSLTSHITFLVLISIAFALLLSAAFSKAGLTRQLRNLFYSTMHKRISFNMIVVLMAALIIISGLAMYYFYLYSNESHQERLVNKQEEVLAGLKSAAPSIFTETPKSGGQYNPKSTQPLNLSQKMWDYITAELAEIHYIDINIFDDKGKLISSSQSDIFEKGLVSGYMDPTAFRTLSNEGPQYHLHKEKIGNLQYNATYLPVRNINGQTIAFLNLPYFATQVDLRRELSNVMFWAVNICVIFIIITGWAALTLSDKITDSLKLIRENLNNVSLERNQLLTWPDEDEIGALVNQYNKMLLKLEESARLLAQSERETAWQEMARNVAHEIKNPLTPMKLSIQYLERAILNKQGNAEALAQRVCSTLIEQINTLSRIASEFAAFAKMPTAQNEVFDLKTLLDNVVNLYVDSNPDAEIFKSFCEADCLVYADRNHIARVFNNLFNNAIQAIPDERKGVIQSVMRIEGDFIKISVEDNGSGISDEAREKVFIPNFSTKSSGRGLGLAMTKGIVEHANGKIWFETEVGRGTTFFVMLPLAKVASAPVMLQS